MFFFSIIKGNELHVHYLYTFEFRLFRNLELLHAYAYARSDPCKMPLLNDVGLLNLS